MRARFALSKNFRRVEDESADQLAKPKESFVRVKLPALVGLEAPLVVAVLQRALGQNAGCERTR